MCHSIKLIMKSFCDKYIQWLLPLFAIVLTTGCAVHSDEMNFLAQNEAEHTLVMYLLAENNLSTSIYNNALDAEEGMIGASPSTRLVIYLDSADETKLYEVRYLPYGEGGEHIRHCKTLKTYPRQTSTTAEVMKTVMEDVVKLAPSRTYGLVMSGHGTGWFPKPTSGIGYESQKVAPLMPQVFGGENVEYFFDLWRDKPETRAMGYDYALGEDGSWNRNEEESFISSQEIIEGLSPIHFNYIIFDACFMSSIEFLYDMRYSADYIVASPVEILAVGLPYTEIVGTLMKHTSNIRRLGDVVMDVYMRDNSFTSRKSLALTMIDCSKLDDLADAVAAIYSSIGAEDCVSLVEQRLQKAIWNGQELPYFEGIQTLDRMRPAGFHDFEDFVLALTDDKALEERFLAAFDDVVVWNCHTEDIFALGYSLDGMAYGRDNIEYKVGGKLSLCGISTYIPIREAPTTLSYYLQTPWAQKIYQAN